jgi:hypothetical protein
LIPKKSNLFFKIQHRPSSFCQGLDVLELWPYFLRDFIFLLGFIRGKMHRIRTGSAPDLSPVVEAIQEYDDSALEGKFPLIIVVILAFGGMLINLIYRIMAFVPLRNLE